jgi:hypothetical protein
VKKYDPVHRLASSTAHTNQKRTCESEPIRPDSVVPTKPWYFELSLTLKQMNRGGETTFKFYEILEADPCCTDEQLKRAYRKKALKLHPDKTGGREQADFIAVNEAYKILKDPYLRKYYNRHGDQGVEIFKTAGSVSMSLLESKSFLTKFFLKVMTHPFILAPFFIYIGLQFLLIVLFLWFADCKFEGWQASWTAVFTCLWIPLASVAMLALSFTVIASYLNWTAHSNSSEEAENLDEDQKKKMKLSVFYLFLLCLAFDVPVIGIIWSSVLLHNSLVASTSWNATVWPLAWSAYILVAARFVKFALQWPTFKTSRIRLCKLGKICANGLGISLLLTALSQPKPTWLVAAACATFVIFSCVGEYFASLESKLKCRSELERVDRTIDDPIEARQAKEKLATNAARMRTFGYLFTGSVLLQFCFFASHLLFEWPRSWTWTIFLVVISASIQIITFALVIPLILLAMDRMLPDISDKTLSELQTGASADCVVIDLPAKTIYSFGYALGRFQPRIKGRK